MSTVKRAGRDPGEQHLVDVRCGPRRSSTAGRRTRRRSTTNDAAAHQRGEPAGERLAEPAAEHEEDQEAGQRQGRDQPDEIEHGAPQPFSIDEVVGGGAGPAAEDGHDDAEADHDLGGGDDEHEEHDRPGRRCRRASRANATNVRLTALSISSTHMNITSGLRRTSRPTAPMREQHGARGRGTSVVVGRRRASRVIVGSSSRLVVVGRGRSAPGEHDGADDGDHEQHRR